MKLKQHYNLNTFLKETSKYLEKTESLNNLMLGICNRIKDDPNYYTNVYMATVSNEGGLVLAAIKTDMEKLIVYGTRYECDEAIELIVKDILSKSIYIPGVIGPEKLSKRASEIWGKHVNSNVKLDVNMRVYELREVDKNLIGKGKLRLATERDIEFIAKGIYEFEIDAGLNNKPNKEKCLEEAKKRISAKVIYLWEYEGKIVSMAAKARPTQNGVTVNLVYTPKELRRKGYATGCVAALSQHLLDSGYKFCTLFTDLENPISNSIYMKIGYKPVGDFDTYIIENIESRCGILCNECEYKDSMDCEGCMNINKPFWGEQCPVKVCCESKDLKHCGNCEIFPCDLLTQFAYDKEQGDGGKRIEQCKMWCEVNI